MAKVTKREWRLPSGEVKSAYVVRWIETGKHCSRQFSKKRDADAFRVTLEGDQARHKLGRPVVTTTIGEITLKFMILQEQRLADGRIGRGSYRNFERSVRLSINPFLGKRRVSELSESQLSDWYQWMLGRKLAPTTARDRIADLGQICDFAVSWKLATDNPVPAGSKQFRGIVRKPVRTMTPDQVRHLLATADVRAFHQKKAAWRMTRCIVNLAAFCGLRIGEIFGLTTADIDLSRNVLRIRHSLTDFDVLKEPKTRSGLRTVPLPPHLAELLKDWLAAGYVVNERNLVFRPRPRGEGAKWSPAYWWRRNSWLGLLDRAGMKDAGEQFHFHSLRHFASSWWIHTGMPVTDAARLLGHKKFDTTLQVYAHSLSDMDDLSGAVVAASATLLSPPIVTPTAQ